MNRKLLRELRREVAQYSDNQLWALFHLTALELESRGEIVPEGADVQLVPDTPDAVNRSPELAD